MSILELFKVLLVYNFYITEYDYVTKCGCMVFETLNIWPGLFTYLIYGNTIEKK